MLYIKKVRNKGRGVFSTTLIKKGTLIEECPLILCPLSSKDSLVKSGLGHHALFMEDSYGIMLGYGSLYNHSFYPNCELTYKKDTALFTALEDINPNEEIVFDYAFSTKEEAQEWGITIPSSVAKHWVDDLLK